MRSSLSVERPRCEGCNSPKCVCSPVVWDCISPSQPSKKMQTFWRTNVRISTYCCKLGHVTSRRRDELLAPSLAMPTVVSPHVLQGSSTRASPIAPNLFALSQNQSHVLGQPPPYVPQEDIKNLSYTYSEQVRTGEYNAEPSDNVGTV